MISTNPLTTGMRGALGKTLVFRQDRGMTVVQNMPRKPDKRKETAPQRETRLNFKDAAAYAVQVLQNAEKRAYYTQKAKALKLRNAYTAAVTDYMRKGKINHVDTRKYTGVKGSRIRVRAGKKGFEIRSVMVTIQSRTGELLEQGHAVHNGTGEWVFRSNKDTGPEAHIHVEAFDYLSSVAMSITKR